MNQAFIFVGTNIAREENYLRALRQLAALGRVTRVSAVYETAPVGSQGAQNFFNGAVLLETPLDAPALKQALREIEARMGRVRTGNRNAPRPIDLDLALFNDERVDLPDLHLPDPLILQRPFMATALAELNPDYVHPVTGERLGELAARGAAASEMRLVPALSAEVRREFANLYSGEAAHA